MEDVKIEVLSTKLEGLAVQVQQGFSDVKGLIRSGSLSLNEHIKEDKETFLYLNKELETLKIDMAKFKERWLLIGASISLFGATLIELITHILKP